MSAFLTLSVCAENRKRSVMLMSLQLILCGSMTTFRFPF